MHILVNVDKILLMKIVKILQLDIFNLFDMPEIHKNEN